MSSYTPRYQMALTNIAQFGALTDPSVLDRLLREGDTETWCRLATRTDVPESAALAAIKLALPTGSVELTWRQRNILLEAPAVAPAVQRWLATHLRAGADQLFKILTDPDAVAAITRRACSGSAPRQVWKDTSRKVVKSAAAMVTVHELTQSADHDETFTAIGLADLLARRINTAETGSEYQTFTLEALRHYGTRNPEPASTALRTIDQVEAAVKVSSSTWLTAAARDHVFEVLLANLAPGHSPSAGPASGLQNMYPRLTDTQQLRLRERAKTLKYNDTQMGSFRWLRSLTIDVAVEQLAPAGTESHGRSWGDLDGAGVAEALAAVAHRVTPQTAAYLIGRADVDSDTAALLLAKNNGPREWLDLRPADRAFQVRALAAHTLWMVDHHDTTLVLDALVHRLTPLASVSLDQPVDLHGTGLADRLGPDGVWQLPWPMLTLWAREDDTVARWAAQRLESALVDEDLAPVVVHLLQGADAAFNLTTPAADLLTAAAATSALTA